MTSSACPADFLRRAAGLAAFLVLLSLPAFGQSGARVMAGVHLEHNSSLQPGIEVGYSRSNVLGGHPRLIASYSTSRLSVAFGSNGLAKDRFLVAAGWYFRPERVLDPYVQIEAGYTRFDREDPELFALLDNSAGILSLLFGLEARVGRGVGIYGDLGYSAISSSTVYPFVTSLGVNLRLP